MADAKVSALAALTGANVDTAADVLMIVDTDATASKKITVDELRTAIGPVIKTVTATTSGTEHDYTSIPSWVKRITLTLSGVSTNGSANLQVLIGDSGGFETSGYLGSSSRAGGAGDLTGGNSTTGADIIAGAGSTADIRHGEIRITLVDASSNTWVITGIVGFSNAARTVYLGYSKSLSGTLDRIRLVTTDTFDAGSINVIYE